MIRYYVHSSLYFAFTNLMNQYGLVIPNCSSDMSFNCFTYMGVDLNSSKLMSSPNLNAANPA